MFTANPGAVIGSAVQVWAAHSPDIDVSLSKPFNQVITKQSG
jgi:hypothetical protein